MLRSKGSKLIIILTLALVMVAVLASIAMAAQLRSGCEYLATPKVFNADKVANYPNEIYLTNEQNPGLYRIHTNYSSTTDACASCHSTHTAVGEVLLQWGSIYDTCMACHDGTVTTTYDVANGEIGKNGKATYGGMFGVGDEVSYSSHLVNGTIQITAAPGGSAVEQNGFKGKKWTGEFGCASCHTPHGAGGNARILNPNPNNVVTSKWSDVLGADGIVKNGGVNKRSMTGRGYDLYYDSDTAWNGNETIISATYVNNDDGYTKITDASVVGKYVYFYPTVRVTMNVQNYLATNETVTHVSGMNEFCGACHTDYDTTSVSSPHENASGTYAQAYRHKVGRSTSSATKTAVVAAKMAFEAPGDGKYYITCLTCHVAHGTSKDYWVKTIGSGGSGYVSDDKLVEVAGSSALKRVPNMGTCEACHEKGDASKGYNANSGNDGYTETSNSTPPTSVAGATFVGKAVCAQCHEQTVEEFGETPHAKMMTSTTAAQQDEFASELWGAAVVDGVYTYEDGISFSKDDIVLTLNWEHDTVLAKSKVSDLVYIIKEGEQIFTEPEAYSCTRCHTTPRWGADGIGATGTLKWTPFKAALDAGQIELGISCEDCHGQGSKHVASQSAKDILNPAKFSQQAQSNDTANVGCGRCHGSGSHNGEFWKALTIDWNASHSTDAWEVAIGAGPSKHYLSNAVGCNTCHQVHKMTHDTSRDGKAKVNQLKMPVRTLCNSCHDSILTDLASFDKYLPLKANGDAGHLFNGNTPDYSLYPGGVRPEEYGVGHSE